MRYQRWESYELKRENGNTTGEVKVKVRGVHLFLMVIEDDKIRNECAAILFNLIDEFVLGFLAFCSWCYLLSPKF